MIKTGFEAEFDDDNDADDVVSKSAWVIRGSNTDKATFPIPYTGPFWAPLILFPSHTSPLLIKQHQPIHSFSAFSWKCMKLLKNSMGCITTHFLKWSTTWVLFTLGCPSHASPPQPSLLSCSLKLPHFFAFLTSSLKLWIMSETKTTKKWIVLTWSIIWTCAVAFLFRIVRILDKCIRLGFCMFAFMI